MKNLITLFLVFISFKSFAEPLAHYIDTLIGTASNPTAHLAGISEQRGNTQPSAVVPFGMIQWGPDTTNPHAGSYNYGDKEIKGLSLTHLSGPGCANANEVSILPHLNAKFNHVTPKSFSHQNEKAQAGYYSVKFDDGILVELTGAERSGLGRFSFPDSSNPTISINLTETVTGVKGGKVFSRGENKVGGWANGGNFCGSANSYKVYFAMEFDSNISKLKSFGNVSLISFKSGKPLLMKVAISYVSEENAWENLESEIPGWDFRQVRKEAVVKWEVRLNKIIISGATDTQKRIFYTAFYHALLHPNIYSDVNGEYLGFDQKVYKTETTHYANFSGWDIYRTQIPFLAFLFPEITSEIVQSHILDASRCGGFPKWSQNNNETAVMAGDSGPIIVSNAYAFGARDFDQGSALEIMKKQGLTPGVSCQGRQIRPGLKDYLKIGYVPHNIFGVFRLTEFANTGQVHVGSPSATIEYAITDFAISQFAKSQGDEDAHETFLSHANNWQNVFDANVGHIRPKYRSGRWKKPFNLFSGRGYTEGSAAQYTYSIPFAQRELVGKFKNEEILERLEDFFSKLNNWGRSPHLWIGNQPGYGAPWIYYWLGKPEKTQDVLTRIFNETFTDGPEGLPGNDDLGSTSSWYIFASMGLYPGIPGLGGFLLGKPIYPKVSITLSNGKILELDNANGASSDLYLHEVLFEESSLDSTWIPWETLKNGGKLSFKVGDKSSLWGTSFKSFPPSYGDFILKN